MIKTALCFSLLLISVAARAEEIVTWKPFLRQNGNVYYWNEPTKISNAISRIMYRSDHTSIANLSDGTQYDSADLVMEINCEKRVWHALAQEYFIAGRSIRISRTPQPWEPVVPGTIGERIANRACH